MYIFLGNFSRKYLTIDLWIRLKIPSLYIWNWKYFLLNIFVRFRSSFCFYFKRYFSSERYTNIYVCNLINLEFLFPTHFNHNRNIFFPMFTTYSKLQKAKQWLIFKIQIERESLYFLKKENNSTFLLPVYTDNIF